MPGDLKPVYVLGGGDRPKVTRALERLRGHFFGDAVERLSALEAGGHDAVAACNALGLFGGAGRLVLVEGVEAWKAPDAKAIAAYLASPAPDTVLALVAEGLKADAPLVKACAKAGEILVFDVRKRDLPRWVGEQFARLEARVEPAACGALVELVGEDLGELAAEIEKLALWAGDDEIRERDVSLLVAARGETPGYALTDAWGRRDVAGVLGACEAQLEQASDGRRELTRLVGLLAGHLERVRLCQSLEGEGIPPREAASRLKRHPFYVEKLFGQARNFGVDELREAVVRMARLDLALKGASRLPGELELERTLVEITREPDSRVPTAG
ncbi:MAG: DNA polymerase III subunit delta [Gaiellaceae bacterium]